MSAHFFLSLLPLLLCYFIKCKSAGLLTVHYSNTVTVPYEIDFTLVTEVFTILMNISVTECMSECLYMPACDFVNYHQIGTVCSIIRHVDKNKGISTHHNPSYVYGNKEEWTQTTIVGCESCNLTEKCDISTATPSCVVTSCGPPSVDNFTILAGNLHTIGSSVFIKCAAEVESHQYKSVTCLSNGTWTNTSLNCKPGLTTPTTITTPTTTTPTTTPTTTVPHPYFSCHRSMRSFKTVRLSDNTAFTYRVFSKDSEMNGFYGASETCESYGGRLAKVTPDAKFDMVSELVKCSAFKGGDFWVNVIHINNEYQSQDGDIVPTGDRYWSEMSMTCVRIEGGGGKLNGKSCDSNLQFICEL